MTKSTPKIFAGTLGFLGGITAARLLAGAAGRFAMKTVMTDPYLENLAEFYSAAKRGGLQEILELNLRSETGTLLKRPLGSPKQFIDFDGLMFISAHLANLAPPSTTPVDLKVTIGPKAQKPLQVETPLLVSGMAYQLALTAKVKYALALGSARAGTLTNTGEGPFLPKERELAAKLIIQYPRLPLTRTEEILKQADALEIQIGQGASAGSAQAPFANLRPTKLPAFRQTDDLPTLVAFLRQVGGGVPVGIKFSFTDSLERDLDLCLAAGVDYLALEGCQAATIEAPPILEDDFGLPTLIGLSRAVRHLQKKGASGKVSLIAAGGFFTPGQCLKALALGADAVYLGSACLFALSHTQTLKTLPWEPPTQLVIPGGKASGKFNWREGAKTLANFLNASTEEIKEGVRALGKHSLKEVNAKNLVALDQTTAEITGIPLAYDRRKVRADLRPGGK
ncbi:MAG TPA: FMN-binding glutamate synthase family protein [Firmicutes bacterium]|nr:FMN-binding glutamate synthase family protein [Bacillota bacterium]